MDRPLRKDPTRWPALVMFEGNEPELERLRPKLGQTLAEEIQRQFRDPVLRVRVAMGTAREERLDATCQVPELSLLITGQTHEDLRFVRAGIAKYVTTHAYTFVDLDLGERGEVFKNLLIDFLRRQRLDERVHHQLVRITKHLDTGPANWRHAELPGWELLVTQVLTRDRTVQKRDLLSGLTFGGLIASRRTANTAHFPEYMDHAPPYELVRIRVHAGEVIPRSLSRWARAITHRRVGLALGGSGAWGFAHAALIKRLMDLDIPIDIICGSSSGALVGAYYATLQEDGIKRLLAGGWKLDLLACASLLSMLPLELFVNQETGRKTLTELEVLYYPITSNLTTLKAERVMDADVAWGVRASATAPGIFGRTTTDQAVYVDGAVTGNVPAGLVDWSGANLVVAMNPLPPPVGLRPHAPINSLSDLLHRTIIGFRVAELRTSLAYLLHNVGDLESNGYIRYEPPPDKYPLMKTAFFFRAKHLFDSVQEEPEFNDLLRAVREEWDKLRAPQLPSLGPALPRMAPRLSARAVQRPAFAPTALQPGAPIPLDGPGPNGHADHPLATDAPEHMSEPRSDDEPGPAR